MFDAVHVVVGAVRELNRSQEIGVKPLSCTSSLIWQHGTSLMNYLRMVLVTGCFIGSHFLMHLMTLVLSLGLLLLYVTLMPVSSLIGCRSRFNLLFMLMGFCVQLLL